MSVHQGALRRDLSAGLFTRDRIVAAVLGLLAVLLVFLIVHDVLFPATPTTGVGATRTVALGSVRSAVSSTGTVVPATQQNVGFAQAGTLSEVDVKVGDHVTQGQVLARLDPTALQSAVDQASNNLVTAQSTLNSTVNGNALVQAQHGLASAQQSLVDSQNQVNLTNQQDANALANDQNQLNADMGSLNTANANLAAAQATVSSDRTAVAAAQSDYSAAGCGQANPPSNCTEPNGLAATLQARQTTLNNDTQAQNQAQQAAIQAQSAVNSDQSKLTQDQNKQASDQVSGQRTLDQASASVVTAQDALNSQGVQRPNTIASQQAAVANAQLALQTAQRNLAAATLTAPLDGTVLSISGQVGESVGAGASATAQAPGTTAPQPSGSGATSSSSGTSGGSSGGGSGGGFLVLGNLSGLQVVAPFAEADAARLAANQDATVTFDAVPNLTATARVLAVASSSTVISNVTNYYATLVIQNVDQRLKPGMTANASVVVQQVSNVLTLPNSAITRLGGTSYVMLQGRDGRVTRQPVEIGTVGDQTTEIVSGLNQGDRVVQPQLNRPTTTGNGGGRFGGGGGAVRVGGGG